VIDERETLFNKIHSTQSIGTVKIQNVEDFYGFEITVDICLLLIYLKDTYYRR